MKPEIGWLLYILLVSSKRDIRLPGFASLSIYLALATFLATQTICLHVWDWSHHFHGVIIEDENGIDLDRRGHSRSGTGYYVPEFEWSLLNPIFLFFRPLGNTSASGLCAAGWTLPQHICYIVWVTGFLGSVCSWNLFPLCRTGGAIRCYSDAQETICIKSNTILV